MEGCLINPLLSRDFWPTPLLRWVQGKILYHPCTQLQKGWPCHNLERLVTKRGCQPGKKGLGTITCEIRTPNLHWKCNLSCEDPTDLSAGGESQRFIWLLKEGRNSYQVSLTEGVGKHSLHVCFEHWCVFLSTEDPWEVPPGGRERENVNI